MLATVRKLVTPMPSPIQVATRLEANAKQTAFRRNQRLSASVAVEN
jgi:hypothetical protein